MKCRKSIAIALLMIIVLAAPAVAGARGADARRFVEENAPWLLLQGGGVLPASPLPDRVDPQTGDTRSFWIWDLTIMPPSDREIETTLRAVGENVLIYVDDVEWDSSMNQVQVDLVLAAFEQATAATEESGIYENNVAAFGEPSDIDSNGKLILLYYQVGEFNGIQFDGYFRMDDLGGGATSNQGEVIHLDVDHNSDDYGLGVAAHEFVHMIEYNYDTMEEQWSSEAAAEAAMVVNGYYSDLPAVGSYFRNLHHPLTGWVVGNFPAIDYAQLFLWAAFLLQSAPEGFYRQLIASELTGLDALTDTLSAMDDLRGFDALMGDWAHTILLDGLGVEGEGFLDFDVPKLPLTDIPQATGLSITAERRTVNFFRLETPEVAEARLILNAKNNQGAVLELRATALADDGTAFRTARPEEQTGTLELDLSDMSVDGLGVYLAVANAGEVQKLFRISYQYEVDSPEPDGDAEVPADGDEDSDPPDGTVDGDDDQADGDGASTVDGDGGASAGDSSGCHKAQGTLSLWLLLSLLTLALLSKRRRVGCTAASRNEG